MARAKIHTTAKRALDILEERGGTDEKPHWIYTTSDRSITLVETRQRTPEEIVQRLEDLIPMPPPTEAPEEVKALVAAERLALAEPEGK